MDAVNTKNDVSSSGNAPNESGASSTSTSSTYDPAASGIRAWLFQFTPGEHFALWRLDPNAQRDPVWPSGRHGGEISRGDLVFFWQRGREEGLRGHGIVAKEWQPSTVEGREHGEIEVRELSWRPLVPKASILSAGAIDQFNLVANGVEANLRLNPAEAAALGALLNGPDFPSYPLVWHPVGQRWAGNPVLRQVLAALDIEEATPLAEQVLDAALSQGEDGWRLLSTTRLLLSLATSIDSSTSGEMQCVTAVELAINSEPNLLAAVSRARSTEPHRKPPMSDQEVDETVFALRRAHALSGRVYKRRVLSADAIAAALVTTDSSTLINLFSGNSRTLQDLNQAIALAANRMGEAVGKRWAVLTAPVQLLEPVGAADASGAMLETPATAPRETESAQAPAMQPSDMALKRPIEVPGPAIFKSSSASSTAPEDTSPPQSESDAAVDAALQATSTDASGAPLPTWLGISIAAPGNDDPWGRNLDDKLGVHDEAKAFARLALSKDFRPPLAVGVFGEWGAGKSFFMRLMHEHVERLDAGVSVAQAPEAGQPDFHRNIVQIRFNAWHYVDTNLWASLVDHIFTELDRWAHGKDATQAEGLFENLATARELTLDAAQRLVRRREQQKAAAEQLAKAERDLDEAKKPTIAAYWQALTRLAVSDPGVKAQRQRFDEAADGLGLPQLEKDAIALQAAASAMGDEASRAKLLASGLKSQLGSWRSVILFLALCIVLPALLLLAREALLRATQWPAIAELRGEVLAAAGALAAIAGVFREAAARARKYVDMLANAKASLDTAVAAQAHKPETDVVKQQKVLAQRAGDVAEARATLAASSDRLAEAAREYTSGTGRGRLLRFVRDKVSGGDYAKHLGLVATVRKDFEELATNMTLSAEEPELGVEQQKRMDQHAQQVAALIDVAEKDELLSKAEIDKLRESAGKPPQDPKAGFERILLYIDDLDRCPPDKVVEVLQAVHLLLTFSLFVVVVAVDVRWVSRALERHYPDLLDGPHDDAMNRSAASAHDYLEKIFQIPYWVRPMNDASSIEFLAARVGGVSVEGAGQAAAAITSAISGSAQDSTAAGGPSLEELEEPPAEAARSGRHADITANTPSAQSVDAVSQPAESIHRDQSTAAGAAGMSVPARAAVADAQGRNTTRTLRIEKREEDFMKLLAPFVGGSPRRALRFLNVYRVIKASLGPAEIVLLSGHGGDHALMTQLAIATGAPTLLNGWLGLLAAAPAGADVDSLRASLQQEYWFLTSPERNRLDGALSVYGRTAPKSAQIEALARYAPLARRYSFTG